MTGKGQGAVAWAHQLEPQEDLEQTSPEGDRYWAVLRAAIPLTAPASSGCSSLLWAGLGSRGEQPELP